MKKITLFTLLTLLLCTSCVTKKKFMQAEMAATISKDSLQRLLTDCRNTNAQMSAQIKNLLRDTTKMGNSIRQYQSMLNVNMTEQEKLNALLSQKKNELNERERTINELQDMIKAQNDKVQNLLSNVKDALLGFSTDELTVREKDGKVYVAMSDKLLFQSGSAEPFRRQKRFVHIFVDSEYISAGYSVTITSDRRAKFVYNKNMKVHNIANR